MRERDFRAVRSVWMFTLSSSTMSENTSKGSVAMVMGMDLGEGGFWWFAFKSQGEALCSGLGTEGYVPGRTISRFATAERSVDDCK